MPRPAHNWFRYYVESISDRKIRRLDFKQRWIWQAILAAATDSPNRGHLFIAEDLPMTEAELAEFAGVKERDVRGALALMAGPLHMVTIGEGGLISVSNWGKRQFESDNVTARTRDHRERSKERSNDVPTNVRRNAPETETETETETEQTLSSAPPPSEPISLRRPKGTLPASLSPVFAEFWAAYPKRVGRADAERKFVIAVRAVEPAVLITGARSYAAACVANQTEARFVAHPATWLHQGRWADEAGPAPREDDPLGWAR